MTDDDDAEVIEESFSNTEVEEIHSDFDHGLGRIKRIRSTVLDEEKGNNPLLGDGNCDGVDGCPICFEPWTSGGLHRVCALRCGHLFGKQ